MTAVRRTMWHMEFADGPVMSIYDRTIVGRLARERDLTGITQVMAEWTGSWDEDEPTRRVEFLSEREFTASEVATVRATW